MKTLAILTNGGDTCALNASIKSIRDNAYRVGYKKIYGIRRGYQGLLDGWIDDITDREIDVRIGGSCLGSLRVSPTKWNAAKNQYEIKEQRCHKMAQCLSDYKIDVLVVIGGDGTLQSTKMFQGWVQQQRASGRYRHFEILGFLKTIDNDIRTFTTFQGIEVSLCPGFPSAAKKIISSVEDLRVTARTAERAFSVETMGRDAGWLAAAATLGGAEILLVPELLGYYRNIPRYKKLSEQEVSDIIMNDLVDRIVFFYQNNRNVLIAVAEGFEPQGIKDMKGVQNFVRVITDLYGPRKKVGATELVTMLVSSVLEYYFWSFSHLCDEIRDSADLHGEVRAVMVKADGNDIGKKYDKVQKSERHPLKSWDVKGKLLEAIGLRSGKNAKEGSKQVAGQSRNIAKNSSISQKTGGSSRKEYKRLSSPMSIPPYKFEIRPHRTDYTPRSGPPSAYDYKLATVLGEKIGEMLDGKNKQFGSVPALDKVVPYKDLNINVVKPVPIKEIRTLNFNSSDYFDQEVRLHVSERITDLFRTIMTGPDNLEEAIHQYEMEKEKYRKGGAK